MGFLPKSSEKGQILLVVVLAAVISLTVGLAAVSRTVTNSRITNDEADSQKALAAAEAGVEQLVSNPQASLSVTFNNSSNVSATTTSVSGQEILINGGNEVDQDDGVDIWLSDYSTYNNKWSGNLKIYWSDDPNSTACNGTSSANSTALEIYLVYGASSADPSTSRYTYDPCSARQTSTGFSAVTDNATTTILGETFNHSVTIAVSSGIVARVTPLYADTRIAVRGYTSGNIPQDLPSQGSIIESTGKAGTASRKVRVFQGYPKLPNEFFTYGLFVPST
ncbi:hypothetical protein E6Q11_04610 [Candidatus Dojkabacteria bacterium]|uniref:Type 4 fimbrial biogenesis protein PilX N-terminal domain-containing protein n=1 Tax=Candidatus Dojkabacteria bacterium TaxID=2099670 RepID=A0A5C7J4S6_9BACT|nr:MAG: hypothetical protein E6Q11_04610 [Candidatus Dojkabacteria bacterium]